MKSTYDQLNKMADSLSMLKQKGSLSEKEEKVLNKICDFYICVEENMVNVTLSTIDDYSVEYIKSNVEQPEVLNFMQGEKVEEQATKVKLGQAVYIDSNPKDNVVNKLSVGIKAYYINSKGDKVHGFITAAHGCKNVGDPVYISTNTGKSPIGKVVKRKYSGKVDAAFVKVTNSNYVASKIVYYSNSKGKTTGGVTISKKLYTYLFEGAIGETVYKAGAKTYLTKGKLVSDSATCVYDGKTIKDLYQSNYNCANGDSGGVVYYHDEDGYQYLGIHVASGKNSNGTKRAYAVKWQNIDDSWGIYFE